MNEHQQGALLLVSLLAFAEACVGVGMLVSGVLLLIVCTTLYSTDVASLGVIVPLAMIGALLGDHLGFYLGHAFGPRIHDTAFADKHRLAFERGDALILQYGGFAIFIGRFVPAIRSIVPALVGVSGFPARRFSILDFCACLLWSFALGGLVILIERSI